MSGKKIAEISLVFFFIFAALAVFIVFYMHSDSQRAAEIEAYMDYKYGVAVDENKGITISGDEFSLITSDNILVLGTCNYFGEVLTESYVNYYYADDCVEHINEKIGDCFSDCVIVYDGVHLSELGNHRMDTNFINDYEGYVAAAKNACEADEMNKNNYKISIRVYVRESEDTANIDAAITRLQDSGEYFNVYFYVVTDVMFNYHKEHGIFAYCRGGFIDGISSLDKETGDALVGLIYHNNGLADKYLP